MHCLLKFLQILIFFIFFTFVWKIVNSSTLFQIIPLETSESTGIVFNVDYYFENFWKFFENWFFLIINFSGIFFFFFENRQGRWRDIVRHWHQESLASLSHDIIATNLINFSSYLDLLDLILLFFYFFFVSLKVFFSHWAFIHAALSSFVSLRR